MRPQLFFQEKYACSRSKKGQKKVCTHIFCEFGESLEILQTHFVFVFFWKNSQKNENWHQTNTSLWAWSEFGNSPNSLQTRSKLICFQKFFFCFSFWGGIKGVSSEILQTLSKLAPNKAFFFIVFGTGVCLEWLGDSPNSVEFGTPTQEQQIFCFCGQELKCSNVSMRLRSEFGHSPNSLQTHSKFKCFPQFKKDKGQCLRVAYGPHFCFKKAKKRNFKSK